MVYAGDKEKADAAYKKRARAALSRLYGDVGDGYFGEFYGTYKALTGKWAVTIHPVIIHIPGRLHVVYSPHFAAGSFTGMLLVTDDPHVPSWLNNAYYMHGTPTFETTIEQIEAYDPLIDLDSIAEHDQPRVGKGHNSEQYGRVKRSVSDLLEHIRDTTLFNERPAVKARIVNELERASSLLTNVESFIKDVRSALEPILRWLANSANYKWAFADARAGAVRKLAGDGITYLWDWIAHAISLMFS